MSQVNAEIKPPRRRGGKTVGKDLHVAFCTPLKRCEVAADYGGYRFETLGMKRSPEHDRLRPGQEAWTCPMAEHEARRDAARAESRRRLVMKRGRRGGADADGAEDHGEQFVEITKTEALGARDAEIVGDEEGGNEGFDA